MLSSVWLRIREFSIVFIFNIKNINFLRSSRTSNDINQNDNQVIFNTQIYRRAELELTGVSIPQEIRFGGEVKGESAMVRLYLFIFIFDFTNILHIIFEFR